MASITFSTTYRTYQTWLNKALLEIYISFLFPVWPWHIWEHSNKGSLHVMIKVNQIWLGGHLFKMWNGLINFRGSIAHITILRLFGVTRASCTDIHILHVFVHAFCWQRKTLLPHVKALITCVGSQISGFYYLNLVTYQILKHFIVVWIYIYFSWEDHLCNSHITHILDPKK